VFECSLIDLIPEIKHTLVPLFGYLCLTTLEVRVASNHPSSPVVMIVFYHAMEVSCYHSFWAVKLQLCLCLDTLGSITCKYFQVFSKVRRMLNCPH
jgi:hypothetical protein